MKRVLGVVLVAFLLSFGLTFGKVVVAPQTTQTVQACGWASISNHYSSKAFYSVYRGGTNYLNDTLVVWMNDCYWPVLYQFETLQSISYSEPGSYVSGVRRTCGSGQGAWTANGTVVWSSAASGACADNSGSRFYSNYNGTWIYATTIAI